MSSRLALFFAAGYLPPLVTAHHEMLAFAAEHAEEADLAISRVADEELDRLQYSGLAEVMQQRLLRIDTIADTLGVALPPPPEDPVAAQDWQRAIDISMHLLSATDQADAMAYNLGSHAGEIVRLINRQASLVRYQIAGDTPTLAALWTGIAAELPVRLQQMLMAASFGGLPAILRDLGHPFATVVNDVMIFQRRPDDKLYLVLLGRNLQNEMYSLIDQIEATEEKLKASRVG
jgi:hypothetical protein